MKRIWNTLLLRFKEKSLRKKAEKARRRAEYKGIREIKRALVFWCAHACQQEWLRQAEENFPAVQFDKLCFVSENGEMPEKKEWVVMQKEDLGFGGKIYNERLLTLLQRKYDLLIDLTPESSAWIDYVLMHNQAAFIAGRKKAGETADIVIEGVNEPLSFISKLKEVLSGINKY